MTRLELLQLVVGRARSHGFEFRRWYTGRLGLPWISADASLRLLESQRRYYALLFSHEFAQCFWKTGSEITFAVEASSFERRMPDGSLRTVQRKPYIRRSARRDVWRYHLRQMALAEEPLRYLRKYLHVEEPLDPEPEPAVASKRTKGKRASTQATKAGVNSTRRARTSAAPKPLPDAAPAFLRRPYPGSTS